MQCQILVSWYINHKLDAEYGSWIILVNPIVGGIYVYELNLFRANKILQGHVEDVRRQVNEAIEARQVNFSLFVLMLLALRIPKAEAFELKIWIFDLIDLFGCLYIQKIDRMYAAFTGQPLEKVQQYTERDRFLSASEVICHWSHVEVNITNPV